MYEITVARRMWNFNQFLEKCRQYLCFMLGQFLRICKLFYCPFKRNYCPNSVQLYTMLPTLEKTFNEERVLKFTNANSTQKGLLGSSSRDTFTISWIFFLQNSFSCVVRIIELKFRYIWQILMSGQRQQFLLQTYQTFLWLHWLNFANFSKYHLVSSKIFTFSKLFFFKRTCLQRCSICS